MVLLLFFGSHRKRQALFALSHFVLVFRRRRRRKNHLNCSHFGVVYSPLESNVCIFRRQSLLFVFIVCGCVASFISFRFRVYIFSIYVYKHIIYYSIHTWVLCVCFFSLSLFLFFFLCSAPIVTVNASHALPSATCPTNSIVLLCILYGEDTHTGGPTMRSKWKEKEWAVGKLASGWASDWVMMNTPEKKKKSITHNRSESREKCVRHQCGLRVFVLN